MHQSRVFFDSRGSQMQPTRTTLMAPRSVVSASSSASLATRRETTKELLIDYEPRKIKRTVPLHNSC